VCVCLCVLRTGGVGVIRALHKREVGSEAAHPAEAAQLLEPD
jgi:hypothetical protein